MGRVNEDRGDDLIELGTISAETKGPGGSLDDEVGELIRMGLTD